MTDAVTPPNPSFQNKDYNKERSLSPDPTLMTIDALRREISMLENLLNAQIEAESELTKEKFHRVDEDLNHFEAQRLEQKQDTRQAVDAALESQKEATLKMENSVTNQIASLKNNFETSVSGVQSAISDLKDRITILESVKQGQSQQREETRQITSGQIAALGIGLTIIIAIMTIISFVAGGSA